MCPPPKRHILTCAFTLLELVTVVLVVAILIVILLPVYAGVQRRVEKTGCATNLRSLTVAVNLYMQEHRGWPQVKTDGVDPQEVATNWINVLKPYGLSQASWLCPTVQKSLQSPDMTDPNNVRIDYAPMSFDANPQTPFRWANMPWFAETLDVHGNGQLLIFKDGHIQEMGDFRSILKKNGQGTGK